MQLEHCPFCGTNHTLLPDSSGRYQQIVCGACGARGPEVYRSLPYTVAVESWNGRNAPCEVNETHRPSGVPVRSAADVVQLMLDALCLARPDVPTSTWSIVQDAINAGRAYLTVGVPGGCEMNDYELNRRELTGDDALRFAREAGMLRMVGSPCFTAGVGDLIRFARLCRAGWTPPASGVKGPEHG